MTTFLLGYFWLARKLDSYIILEASLIFYLELVLLWLLQCLSHSEGVIMSVSCPEDLFLLCLGVSFTSRWFYLLFSSVLSLPEFCLTDFIFLGLLIFLGRLILVVSPRSSMLVSCEVICSSKIYSSNLLSSIFLRNALTNPLPFRKLISLSRAFSSPDFYPH